MSKKENIPDSSTNTAENKNVDSEENVKPFTPENQGNAKGEGGCMGPFAVGLCWFFLLLASFWSFIVLGFQIGIKDAFPSDSFSSVLWVTFGLFPAAPFVILTMYAGLGDYSVRRAQQRAKTTMMESWAWWRALLIAAFFPVGIPPIVIAIMIYNKGHL